MVALRAESGHEGELLGLEKKATSTGAAQIYIDSIQDELPTDFIYPSLRAGATYEGQYFLATSIARPLIAKRMVEIAKKEKADAIAHGATGKGNDQVRFELTAAALAPDLQVIAPWRDERYRTEFPGRQALIDYCAKHKLPVQASAQNPFSMDRNPLHLSYEPGTPEDPCFRARAGTAPRRRQRQGRQPHQAGPGHPAGVRQHAADHQAAFGQRPQRHGPWADGGRRRRRRRRDRRLAH